jgi:hypothetical protein
MFPLMVHDEMVTVPPPATRTPPPCKQQAKRQQEFPLGRWEKFRSLRHVHSVVDRPQLCKRESKASTLAIFPSGRWELLSVSAHIISCVPVDRGRRYRDRDRAGRDVDTASLKAQVKNICENPIGALGNLRSLPHVRHSRQC